MNAIRDYISGFYDGPHATPKEAGEGPIFLGIRNVTPDGRLDFSEIRHVSDAEFPKWTKRVTPKKDDIVFTYEATLHRYAIIPDGFHGCLGRRMALMRPDTTKVFPRFLHYYCLSSAWRKEAEASVTSGATVDRIPLTKVPDFKVNFPDLPTQERIAAILSAYDDLIENNRRRIALLEQAARLLYREWFVHFRFPGHETVTFVDGLPEGWELKTYGELFNFLGGFAFKSSSYVADGRYGVVTIKNVHDGRFVQECASRVPDIPTKMKPHCRLETGDVLLSLTGNVGRACIVVGDNYLLNQRVAKILGRAGVPKAFTYWTFSNYQTVKDLENLAYGVAQLNLSPVNLAARDFVRPADSVLAEFDRLLSPAFDQLINLTKQNAQLTKSRDLLLPRLMDGRITV